MSNENEALNKLQELIAEQSTMVIGDYIELKSMAKDECQTKIFDVLIQYGDVFDMAEQIGIIDIIKLHMCTQLSAITSIN